MRKPKVENKYNLKPKDIQKAIILDYERLKQLPFWRNDVVQAWCLSGSSAKTKADWEYGTYDELIHNIMEDLDPFPYDLTEAELLKEVKYSLGIEPYPEN